MFDKPYNEWPVIRRSSEENKLGELKLSICGAVLWATCSAVAAQEIRVASSAMASPSEGGWHVWYEAHVDPKNARNMIMCGSRLNAKENAFKTFVYYSSDGGESWMQAFLDTSADWDGEQSCAYGVQGVAYLVSDATKVINGEMHHELGKTHIYVSHDSGRTWNLAITTGWTDYSTSVVDTAPGPNQNRLYLFFNDLLPFYSSLGEKEAVELAKQRYPARASRVSLISYRDGDNEVAGPFSNDLVDQEGYHGSYPSTGHPSPAFLLKDGSIVSLFSTEGATEKGTVQVLVEAVRTGPGRTNLEAPVQIADSPEYPDPETKGCGTLFLSTGGAYDAIHDTLYFAYPNVRENNCRLWLTMSTDGGRTWSKGHPVWSPGREGQADGHVYAHPALAVNKDGVLGLLWQDRQRSGCWRFAISTDRGTSFSRAEQLGTCSGEASKPSQLSTAHLWTSFFQPDPKDASPAIEVNLRNTWNGVGRNQNALVTTPDGRFHAVWQDAGNGEGELRTAVIQVVPADTLISMATRGMEDITRKTVVLYGGDQHYDPKTRIVTLEVTVRNESDHSLSGPVKLAVAGTNDLDFAEIANADNQVSGAGAVWDISPALPNGVLISGGSTKPIALKFRYLARPDTPRNSDDILTMNIRIYAKERN